jgi:TetR/AcrR family fatty acid metabolism transcriptional regulator
MRTKEGNKERDILEAAVQVFAEYGFHKSKIAKIAEVANVAAGSVYSYFKNKEDILQKIYDQLWRKLFNQTEKIVENEKLSPNEKLDGMLDLVFDIFAQNPSMAIVIVNEQYNFTLSRSPGIIEYYEKFLDLGENIIREGQKKGIYSRDVDIPVMRYYMFGAVRYLVHNWARDPEAFPMSKIRATVKYLIKHGIMK